jgi:hypothetical protein
VDHAGDYLVEFVDVGDGKGEYAVHPDYSGSRIAYLFVGEGNGRYIPCRDLPAPESRRLGDLRWETVGSRARISLEGAVSGADGNVLSAKNDDDNTGAAILAEGEAKAIPLGNSLQFTPRLRWRRVGEQFESPARLRAGFFGRDWNLSGTETIREENLLEAGAALAFRERVRWTSNVGHLALADTFSAFRQEQALALDTRWVAGSAAWNTVQEEVKDARGALDRWGGEVLVRRYALQPRLRPRIPGGAAGDGELTGLKPRSCAAKGAAGRSEWAGVWMTRSPPGMDGSRVRPADYGGRGTMARFRPSPPLRGPIGGRRLGRPRKKGYGPDRCAPAGPAGGLERSGEHGHRHGGAPAKNQGHRGRLHRLFRRLRKLCGAGRRVRRAGRAARGRNPHRSGGPFHAAPLGPPRRGCAGAPLAPRGGLGCLFQPHRVLGASPGCDTPQPIPESRITRRDLSAPELDLPSRALGFGSHEMRRSLVESRLRYGPARER